MAFRLRKEFDEPQDSRDETLAFVCVHAFPEDVPAQRPDYGFLARVRDGTVRIFGRLWAASAWITPISIAWRPIRS